MSIYAKVISAALIVVLSAILFCIAGYDASAFKRCKALGKVHSTFLAVLVFGFIFASVPKPPSGDDPSGAPGGLCMAPEPQHLLSPSPESAAPQFAPFTNVIDRLMVTGLVRAGTSTWYRVGWAPSDSAPAFVDLLVSDDLTSADWTFLTRLTVLPAATNLVVEVPDALMPGTNCVGFVRFGLPLDSDGDGTTDAVEHYVSHTNPQRDDRDDDHDGLSAADELGAAYVLENDFLWFEPSDNWNYIRRDRGANWMNISLTEGVSIDGTRYCQIHTTWDGIVHLYPNDDYSGWEYAHGDLLLSGDLANDPLSGGFVTVIAADADVYYRPTAWGSGVFVSTVVTNGTSYDVIECRNVGLESESTSGTNSLLSYEIILPRDEPNVVYVSYARVDDGFRALGMNLGLQCQMLRNPVATNEFYHLHSPVSGSNLVAGTTIRYEIGTATDPNESDSDGDGSLDGSDPFPRDTTLSYYGQCDDWVRANFTNAEEILDVGYAEWVDEQVGVGLENGLYKLTVSITNVPSERFVISVGDLDVVATNTGNFVFLLEKATEYSLAVEPDDVVVPVFTAADDCASVPLPMAHAGTGYVPRGHWSEDDRGLEIVEYVHMIMGIFPRRIVWHPKLSVTPRTKGPDNWNEPWEVEAVVTDAPPHRTIAYQWRGASGTVRFSSPNESSTDIYLTGSVYTTESLSLSVEARIGSDVLTSSFTVELMEDVDSESGVLSLTMPDTIFVNNDDDDGNGTVDWESVPFMDDDIAEGRIVLSADCPSDYSVTVRMPALLDAYDDIGFGAENRLGLQWTLGPADMRLGKDTFRVNASSTSTRYRQLAVSATCTSGNAVVGSVRKHVTVVEPVVEPICSNVYSVVENGTSHDYVFNPCAVVVGREARYSIEVKPDDFPDERIVWSVDEDSTGSVEFVDDENTGRVVSVRGVTEGNVKLKIQIGDATSHPPTFDFKVVTNSVVKLSAWIVERNGLSPRSVEEVRELVRRANDIFAQVGVTLDIGDRISVTNIPNAYDILWENGSETMWDFDRLVSSHSGTGGLELYFVNSIIDLSQEEDVTTVAGHSARGIVVSASGRSETLAHEIGHAFGMDDIYVEKLGVVYPTNEVTCSESIPADWSGGCNGLGEGGTRYYQSGLPQCAVMRRMLMNGRKTGSAIGRDMTFGPVKGISAQAMQGSVETGFFMNAKHVVFPVHQ